MRRAARTLLPVAFAFLCLPAAAQERAPAPASAPAVDPNKVAATVNGQPILEMALQRGLKAVPAAKHADVRPEILNRLVDNLLIEQHLLQLTITVDNKEVDAVVEEIKGDIKKANKTFEEVMKELQLSEDELRTHITADRRWNKFVDKQVTDKALKDLFEANKDMFDGSMVRARHLQLTPAANDAKAGEQAKAQLLLWRKQIEEQVAAGLAKLPPASDNLAREQARTRLLDDAFAALAREKSQCASKEVGGDVGEFPRVAHRVEAFAKTAFALKPYQMSDVVQTPFGYHLILVTNRRPGRDVKFDDVKEEVRELFSAQLREQLAPKLRQTAKIEIAKP